MESESLVDDPQVARGLVNVVAGDPHRHDQGVDRVLARVPAVSVGLDCLIEQVEDDAASGYVGGEVRLLDVVYLFEIPPELVAVLAGLQVAAAEHLLAFLEQFRFDVSQVAVQLQLKLFVPYSGVDAELVIPQVTQDRPVAGRLLGHEILHTTAVGRQHFGQVLVQVPLHLRQRNRADVCHGKLVGVDVVFRADIGDLKPGPL